MDDPTRGSRTAQTASASPRSTGAAAAAVTAAGADVRGAAR
ncbi:hypothetical protein [Clavibacter sp. VKM Ac-2872]|nr:hypothetical protein [Clavibacter sp. VKM Ac-2872]